MIHIKWCFFVSAACLIFTAGGCKKDNDDFTEIPPNSYFMQGTFNGGTFSMTNCSAISASYSSTSSVSLYYYISGGSYNTGAQGDSIDGADIVMYHTFAIADYPNGIDSSSLDSLYLPSSSVRFYNPQNATGVVRVDITTGDGVQWSTANGTASQPGSTFSIATRSYIDQYSRVTITGNFSCTLYDNAGHSRRVTNGSYEAYEILQ